MTTRTEPTNTTIHRNAHNQFAVAHAISSVRDPKRQDDDDTPDTAARQLHRLHHHLRQYRPMGHVEFITLITRDEALLDYPVLLQAEQALKTPQCLLKELRTLDQTEDAQAITKAIAEELENFDPPATPLTKEQVRQANEGLTRNQKNHRYRSNRSKLALGIMPFMDLFPNAHTTELFIAAHRWPSGTPNCPNCGSENTTLFRYLPSEEDHGPEFLSQAETGPSLGWHCQPCNAPFVAVTGTLMESPRVPPGELLTLAYFMVLHRTADWETEAADYAGMYHGTLISQEETLAMVQAIQQALPFAKPGVRQTISGLDALKTFVKAERKAAP